MTDFRELDLAERLRIVRGGTAYFADRLGALSDADFAEPSGLPGWSRLHLLAHVGYNALGVGRLMDWATTGVETPMYESAEARNREIDEGAALNPVALRNLFDHSAARLDEKWRNADDAAWSATVRTFQGRAVPAAETLWMRSREVWIHAVDLGSGARFADFPEVVLGSLLDDVADGWRAGDETPDLEIAAEGREVERVGAGADPVRVAGPLPSVVRWMTGRGALGLTSSGRGPVPPPPRWL